MPNETENSRQWALTEIKDMQHDMLASLLDPPTNFPIKIPVSTLILNGITDLLIETAGKIRIIETEEISSVEVDREHDKLTITQKKTAADTKFLQTSTYSLARSVREWVYANDVPSLHFPEQTVYNLPIPTMGIWKVTSSIATREEPIMH